MKILILSCNTGEGHNSSGKALQAALIRHGVECDLKDTLAIKSAWLSKVVSDIYEFSIKISLFGLVYKLAEQYSAHQFKFKSPIYSFSGLYATEIAHLISEGQYDGVICVHLFPAEAITKIRHQYSQYVPAIFVMTDYTCIPLLYETELDKYVIPHPDLIDEFKDKGLISSRLKAVGIPINEERFITRVPKEEARQLVNMYFEWREANGKWFLIMGGSMGFGKISELVKQLRMHITKQDRIICICGRNEKLRKQIKKHFPMSSVVKVLGYTSKIALIMDACDVLLTKPGGITSTEAIIKNIPLVHINPIKGLEEYNSAFFKKKGMAFKGDTLEEQVEMAIQLSNDRVAQERMTEIQRLNSNLNSSNEIADLIINMAQHPQS